MNENPALDNGQSDALPTTDEVRSVWLPCSVVLLLACVLVGSYCCELNRQFYEHHHPFYDSLAYNDKLFQVMTISRNDGFVASLDAACFANTTNCLPFVVAAAIAPVVSPSRMVGVWIQTGLLFLMLTSLLYYFVRIRTIAPGTAVAGCLTFLMAQCLFFENGGLSDFRMDLSLFLTFGTTCCWYFTSMKSPTRLHFLMLGLAASASCLFRATAPIYFLFALGPLYIFDLIFTDHRRQKLTGILLATTVVALLAGWFFMANYDYLKFYYFDWNTDANAKIPFTDAMQHIKFAKQSMGETILLTLMCVGVPIIITTWKNQSIKEWLLRAFGKSEFDLRIAWVAIAPMALLIARRAGLNPFVVMPAVFGMVLFLILPVMKQIDQLRSRSLNCICAIVLIAGIYVSCTDGWKRHTSGNFNTMTAHQQLIDVMVDDTRSRDATQFQFGVMHLSDLNSDSLYSTLLFDRPGAITSLESVSVDSVQIKRISTFARAAATDWRLLDGTTDDAKMNGLIDEANSRIDYLIMPDLPTAQWLGTSLAHNYINRYLVDLRSRVLGDQTWVKVGDSVPTNENETVEIYRKTR